MERPAGPDTRRAPGDTDGAMPLEQILEEEFAGLHPELDATRSARPPLFRPEDIAHVASLSTALLNAARDAAEAAHPAGWERHPPAPASTPLQDVCAFVVSGEPGLVDALRDLEYDTSNAAAQEDRLRVLIAERFNRLLELDLAAMACFAPIVKHLDSSPVSEELNTEHTTLARNRRLLDFAFEPYVATSSDNRLEAIMTDIRHAGHWALCLSGGGIRSASFALGVIQGLAKYQILPRFHYLSTVSGGGFAGGWLSAWMSRAGSRSVWRYLNGAPTVKLDDEPPALRHVRTFSRYLNPQLGMMSADTWTLIASAIRNILLMWVVMVPLLAAALMIPRAFVAWPMTTLHEWRDLHIDPALLLMVLFAGATGSILAALVHVHRYLRQDPATVYAASDSRSTLGEFHMRCLIPLVIGLAILTQAWELFWSMYSASNGDGAIVTNFGWAQDLINRAPRWDQEKHLAGEMLGVYGALLGVGSWLIGVRAWRSRAVEGAACLFAGAAAGWLAAIADEQLFGIRRWHRLPAFYATFSVPALLALCVVGTQIFVGIVSLKMPDAEREAAARLNAWLLIVMVAWISSFGLTLYGPDAVNQVFSAPSSLVAFVLISAATGLLAAKLGASTRRSTDPASDKKSALGRLIALIAAPLFAASIIVLISALDNHVLSVVCEKSSWCPVDFPSGRYDLFTGPAAKDLTPADFAQPQMVVVVSGALMLIGLALGRLIDTNRFSLHAIYSVRLVRTFIGASKAPSDRAPDPFTGFDPTDDMPMSDLWPAKPEAVSPSEQNQGVGHPPLHVLNMTLNVVSSERLATQERKAESFTVTSLHAGSRTVGYRRTSSPTGDENARLYGGPDGISLGTAVAVSGAAASPNAGYHTSPVLTFLMTLFNLRLGRWLGNPGRAGDDTFHRAEPKLAFLSILNEMFGRTTDKSKYVYLSDGSHFENLGLYEMVLRRCRFIVVSDAGCDPEATFDDLGGAIRKIRIDFGIPIEFDSEMAIYPRSMPGMAGEGVYWAVGRIRYSAADRDSVHHADALGDDEDGVLLYLKPAFYGREPRDIYNYARKVYAFPHESTGNQFYGEEQFESYRALGSHVIDELCEREFGSSEGEAIPPEKLDAWISAQLKPSGKTDAFPQRLEPGLAGKR